MSQTPAITPEDILRLAGGKLMSTLFQLALDLDLFARLAGRAVPAAELPRIWDMPSPSARFMAQFLANVRLLVYQDGAVSNSALAEKLLTKDSEIRESLSIGLKYDLSLAEIKEQLLNPPYLHWYQIRDHGEIIDQRSLIRQYNDGWLRNLVERRHNLRIQRGQVIANQYDFSHHRTLLDLGAASGGYCLGIRQKNPALRCIVFDLPEVAEMAQKKISEAGQDEFIEVVAGSFFDDDLPNGADVVLLAQIMHNWSPDDDRLILGKAYAALGEGGTILVHETYLEDDWTGTAEAVLNAFVMIGQEGRSGWQPTYAELEALLAEVGFVGIERRQELVIGRKPSASDSPSAAR